MIAGLSVLLASYGVAVVTGAALVDSHCCEDVGWSLLIPVAGPYIAAGAADEGKGLLVLLGTVQVIGVGLTIGGAVQYALTKNAASKPQASALRLKLGHDRDLSFDLASSPRMTGPTMKLRF
jgi:Flp pilus assembly pilin Flp